MSAEPNHINPIDKDKVTEIPGLITYPHHIGSSIVKPEDVGKLKSRAMTAMQEQTNMHLLQIQQQVELLISQANAIKRRIDVSEKIYTAQMSFEPFIGNTYHLYQKEGVYKLMMIAPNEWGKSQPPNLQFINSVKLLSDHTWEIIT